MKTTAINCIEANLIGGQVEDIPPITASQLKHTSRKLHEQHFRNGGCATEAPQIFHPCLLITFRCVPPCSWISILILFQLHTFRKISWRTGHLIRHQGIIEIHRSHTLTCCLKVVLGYQQPPAIFGAKVIYLEIRWKTLNLSSDWWRDPQL